MKKVDVKNKECTLCEVCFYSTCLIAWAETLEPRNQDQGDQGDQEDKYNELH